MTATLAYRDLELTLHRSGRPEQVWMDLDYSPLPDDEGRPAGVIAIVIETTTRVAAERLRAAAEAKGRLEAERVQLALRIPVTAYFTARHTAARRTRYRKVAHSIA